MLLTKREEQLLKAFLHVGKLSMQDMTEILQVSSRTIYRTLSDLTDSMEQYGIEITKHGKYYILTGELDDLPTELEVLVEYSPQERQELITYRLLTESGFVTNEALQECTKVSNVTIIQDISDIDKRLLDFDLKIERQKGYRISGDSVGKRRFLAILLTNCISVKIHLILVSRLWKFLKKFFKLTLSRLHNFIVFRKLSILRASWMN